MNERKEYSITFVVSSDRGPLSILKLRRRREQVTEKRSKWRSRKEIVYLPSCLLLAFAPPSVSVVAPKFILIKR